MTGDTIGQASAEYRKRRVKRIKRWIAAIVVILLLLPTVLSVFLMVKVSSLQRQIDNIVIAKQAARQGRESEVAQAKEKQTATIVPQVTEKPEVKKVYLTFDDGPGTQTGKILDVLKDKNVKATFFVTGKEDAYSKKMYKRIVREGHTLGMHSYSHIYSQIYESEEAFRKDLRKLRKMLTKVTGVAPIYYRFPGGSTNQNTNVPMQTFIDVLNEEQVTYLDWNVISPDVKVEGASKKEIVRGILEDVSKYETSVVMLYDVADRPATAKALPDIIDSLKKENYELLPVDENTASVRHNQRS